MIMYFDFHTYFRMFRLALKEENPAGRRRLLFILLAVVPVVATFNAVCFFLDVLLFPGLRKVDVRTPVFLIGHARSGTTLMHRLMSMDGERFSSFMLYELYFPSVLQKKLIRLLAECDRRYLGARIEKRVQAWEARKFGPTNDMHRMGLTLPEEDDSILMMSCASGFWIVLFPYMGELDFYYIDQRPEKSRRRMMRFYRECIRRQLYLNGADKIHLSKNPLYCGRVEALIETFPDARIVVLVRNPDETIPSLLKLLQRGWQMRHWDDAKIRRALRIVADMSFHTYRYPFEVLARHPAIRQATVNYPELIDHPKHTVEQVYRELGFPVSAAFSAILQKEEQRAKAHETTHSYNLQEFGLKADEIHTKLGDFFDRFGWDQTPPGAGEQLAQNIEVMPKGKEGA